MSERPRGPERRVPDKPVRSSFRSFSCNSISRGFGRTSPGGGRWNRRSRPKRTVPGPSRSRRNRRCRRRGPGSGGRGRVPVPRRPSKPYSGSRTSHSLGNLRESGGASWCSGGKFAPLVPGFLVERLAIRHRRSRRVARERLLKNTGVLRIARAVPPRARASPNARIAPPARIIPLPASRPRIACRPLHAIGTSTRRTTTGCAGWPRPHRSPR